MCRLSPWRLLTAVIGGLVGDQESEVGSLRAPQVFFQPARLLLPEGVFLRLGRAGVCDIAVDEGEMRAPPIERVIRSGVHEIEVVLRVAFMIPQNGKEGRFAQQFAFDVEENRPQRRILPVGDKVARMHHKIRIGVFENCVDHAAMHIVPRARIAKDHELKLSRAGGRGLVRSLTGVAGESLVVVLRPRF